MLKISLTELEEIRRDPIAYKSKRDAGFERYGNLSYFSVLKNAIYEYHKTSSIQQGMNYLEIKLDRFKNRRMCQKTVDDFHWYITEFQSLGWPAIKKRITVTVPLTTQYWDSYKITGQINRIDMSSNGGYAAWLFKNDNASGWKSELRMPIIQNAVAVELGVMPSMISVGIYSFENHFSQLQCFSENEVLSAHLELEGLLRRMGN
jgi:hypothetical protein